jgi:glycosyltransferase involved in cell wall biosynthesis
MALVYQGIDKEIFYRIGKDEEVAANETLKAMGIEGPYLLSVGTIEPRKNLVNAIKAFHRLKMDGKFAGKFVVVGMEGWLHSNVGKLVEQMQLTREVKFLGYVSDRNLRYLYNKAEVFVFPSFYEGFGFPIIEAFCCEVPVVTSNVSSCPEIAGDAALTVDPGSDEAIAGAIENILSSRPLRDELVEKGRRRAGDFDFRKTAQETLNVYRDVCRKS